MFLFVSNKYSSMTFLSTVQLNIFRSSADIKTTIRTIGEWFYIESDETKKEKTFLNFHLVEFCLGPHINKGDTFGRLQVHFEFCSPVRVSQSWQDVRMWTIFGVIYAKMEHSKSSSDIDICSVCVCVWLLWAVWCLWVIMALTPFPFIPGLLATASGRRNHMMGPFYLSEQFYPPFLIFPLNLSQFAVQYSFKIFIKVVQFPVLINSPIAWLWQGRIGGRVGTFDLILLYDGWVGIHIWAHITIRWIGWSWVRGKYLRSHYYTMDGLELGLIYIRTLASPVHVGTFEPCAAKICSSSNPYNRKGFWLTRRTTLPITLISLKDCLWSFGKYNRTMHYFSKYVLFVITAFWT